MKGERDGMKETGRLERETVPPNFHFNDMAYIYGNEQDVADDSATRHAALCTAAHPVGRSQSS